MYKAIALPLTLLFALFFYSFQIVHVNGKVKTVKYINKPGGDISTTLEYEYDGLGRLILSKDIEQNYSTTTKYIYYRDSVVSQTPDYDGRIMRSTWILNSKGLAVKSPGVANIIYTYNDDGYLIKKEYHDLPEPASDEYQIGNGDIISQKTYNKGMLENSVAYTYYPTPDLSNTGMAFLGKQNKHLVKTSSTLYKGAVVLSDFTYKFDSLGRVAVATISDSKTSYSMEYTYTDK